MEARDYLKAITNICLTYDPEGCKECPLKDYACGMADTEEKIERVVTTVERYEDKSKHEPELKPCPYCGGEGKVKESPVFHNTGPDSSKHTISKAYSVRCTACGGGTKSYDKTTKAKAAWNRRRTSGWY